MSQQGFESLLEQESTVVSTVACHTDCNCDCISCNCDCVAAPGDGDDGTVSHHPERLKGEDCFLSLFICVQNLI